MTVCRKGKKQLSKALGHSFVELLAAIVWPVVVLRTMRL